MTMRSVASIIFVVLTRDVHSFVGRHGTETYDRRVTKPTTEVLAPGIVLVRNALSDREQQQLAAEAEGAGRRSGNGFASADTARLRMYERASKLPRSFTRLCQQVTRIAVEADSAMPNCDATHCLINKYTSAKGLLWHRDIYANDGDGDKPIVNLSVGASCVFGIVDDHTGRTHRVTLRSGDALLFGGACRFAKHAVLDVLLDEAPAWMTHEAPYRLSFTFREAHSVLGKEAFYRTFEVKRRWFEETQRAWRPGDSLVPDPV